MSYCVYFLFGQPSLHIIQDMPASSQVNMQIAISHRISSCLRRHEKENASNARVI